ncbi:hypothetical protein ACH5RR_012833 [Cinchona calisaya]|uniref:Uncharacterized protein n=1 Tax=Cinchona calisaya TaxID=153742 RepID=A0ABD3A8Z3_9GENT
MVTGIFKYLHEKNREEMAKWIVRDELPFILSESSNLEQYMHQAINPQSKKVPRSTLRSDIKRMYKEKKNELMDTIASTNCKVAFTVDSCKSITNENYFCITAHWIDVDWHLQK